MIQIDTFDELIKKYGSKKALIVLAGMFGTYQVPIPEMLEPKWVAGIVIAKVVAIAILGVMGLICQWKLDKQDEQEEPTTP